MKAEKPRGTLRSLWDGVAGPYARFYKQRGIMIENGEKAIKAIDFFDREHEITDIILLGKDGAIRRIIVGDMKNVIE